MDFFHQDTFTLPHAPKGKMKSTLWRRRLRRPVRGRERSGKNGWIETPLKSSNPPPSFSSSLSWGRNWKGCKERVIQVSPNSAFDNKKKSLLCWDTPSQSAVRVSVRTLARQREDRGVVGVFPSSGGGGKSFHRKRQEEEGVRSLLNGGNRRKFSFLRVGRRGRRAGYSLSLTLLQRG